MDTADFLKDVKIRQNPGGYRFSVDALLVAAFVDLPRLKRIADLGAGSGVIGLLLARAYPASDVVLIELQKALAALAQGNVTLNDLQDRVTVINADIRDLSLRPTEGICRDEEPVAPGLPGLAPFSFDLVVSNPPFRKPRTGKISVDDEKAVARHELYLPLNDLVKAAAMLLRHHGRFCVIHLPERLAEVFTAMRGHDLEPKRLRHVHSFLEGEAKMVLIEAVKGGRTGLKVERPLVIYNDDGSYTKEMKLLYES